MSSPEIFLPPADAAIWHAGSNASAQPASPSSPVRPVTARVAGALFLAASLGFLAVFGWLADAFAYPDVLDQPADRVLPALLALGQKGRAVWALYALLPLLLVPAVALAGTALESRSSHRAPARTLLQTAIGLQVISSLAMTIGLARWSTLQWVLAERVAQLQLESRAPVIALSDAFNSYLGNALGEFVGELALYGVFACLSLLLWQRGVRWLALLGALTTLAGWVGMFRNITVRVDPVAAVSNLLLPAFLIALGAWLLRRPRDG